MQRLPICSDVRKKPVILAVNKVDDFNKYMADVYEFYNLGIGDRFRYLRPPDWGSEICSMRLLHSSHREVQQMKGRKTEDPMVEKPNVENPP